ncbi:FAD-binding protein [Aromatoleum toluolicum]|uniref:FAD-binding protein n=1 Tax=Aromatoleum toluolicum TaxID=90060 RepID=A0ABX1NAU9_9RHOO|nr:FAD-binding protein [Aromatoleum toluolicum]NMF96392.1 FAD-binding protein [Aromatoleum toluolicum]
MKAIPEVIESANVLHWEDKADVIVVGYGIAGACAALEAKRAGADVLVVERASGGGGASAMSSGIFYLGGGTPVQKAAGYEDTPDEMYKFLMASTRAPDAGLVRRFCDGCVEHFDWLEAQGVQFERSYYPGKSVFLNTTECLMSTGSEKVWPFRDIAKPAPRGHKVARAGDDAGSQAMEALLARCAAEGIRAAYDSQVTGLVMDADGRIVGVRVKRSGEEIHLRARRGVILSTGGFNLNCDMLEEYVPQVTGNSEPLGIPYNDGAGIKLGVSAGGATQAMDGVIATASFYPPAQLIKGILVNSHGERFVAEDSYHGRTAAHIIEQPEYKAYLILDAEIFAYPELTDYSHHTLVDGWETVEEMEAGLKLPEGSLQRTLAEYNRHAETGVDPLFYKHPEWVKPLNVGPYAAFDVSFNKSTYLFITLGGLKTNADGEVLTPLGRTVAGLYAAGACVSSIPQNGEGYASGLSLGPGSFFGRCAGRRAAAAMPA